MVENDRELFVANTLIKQISKSVTGDFLDYLGERYYRIAHVDQMPAFFMSLVSSSDHWLFIASNGGVSAGRINADSALFPYETEDKIMANRENTGSKTIFRVLRSGHCYLWMPFSERYAGIYQIDRHLYKNSYGNKLIFEEINHDLQLSFKMAWRTGDQFGFIKSNWLENTGGDCQIEMIDGLCNLLPSGANSALQSTMSNLLNAYKKNELMPEGSIGVFSLSAIPSDRAEPSESPRATLVWQTGLDNPHFLLSSRQLDRFRLGFEVQTEEVINGEAGAYLCSSKFDLPASATHRWHIVADVNQDSSDLTTLTNILRQKMPAVELAIEKDIENNAKKLIHFVACADGLQHSADEKTTVHHFANVLFNSMRGGIFAHGYLIDRQDLREFVMGRNRSVACRHKSWFDALPAEIHIRELYKLAQATDSNELIRLCYEYLPLTFSRRHGDPSRPWNQFSINLKKADDSLRLDYEGNWRDIFQNWEALLYSYPLYVFGIIAKFLNATTLDGYNPYRINREGIDWEAPEIHNPWSNIGYWSDHQIIYLQKLLEVAEAHYPRSLSEFWDRALFSYANVPYRLKPYSDMGKNWEQTIDFDWTLHRQIEADVADVGSDGRLLRDATGNVTHVTMVEKLLVLLLTKMANLAPGGGIWMNTQRPEWNDANNALAGKGLSVVTAAYLRRFIAFWLKQLATYVTDEGAFQLNAVLGTLFEELFATLSVYQTHLATGFSDKTRRLVMDDLGEAVSRYREAAYRDGIPDTQFSLSVPALRNFLTLAQSYIDHTLQANLRSNGLIHSYNIVQFKQGEATVDNLSLMLEGQVAYLSSGILTPPQALQLLKTVRQSPLYRPDQHSYMLYPNRKLPHFWQKNIVEPSQIANSKLVKALDKGQDTRLLKRDENGVYHFNGAFRNANDLRAALADLATEAPYAELISDERAFILELYEKTFNHRNYIGRSGVIFAYEGLGSIYWHMVSKLSLAAQECCHQAKNEGADSEILRGLIEQYADIRAGLGFNKRPDQYGAFPTDPYSHTPMGGGARQPGMTGQVKEEVIIRFGELGAVVRDETLCFEPYLLQPNEFLSQESDFAYLDIFGAEKSIVLPPNSLAFTLCQTPIVYTLGRENRTEAVWQSGETIEFLQSRLDKEITRHLLERTGQISLVRVEVNQNAFG